MDKLKFETPDMVAGNIEKIGALFPSAITEMRGEDGQIKKGINFEVLKQLLSRDVVDGDECYEFTWVGKKAAMAEAARPITKTLRPVKEDSRDWDTTQNLYIEGDNLEVLKILQESYLGKVKMIYIDPPYNTGSDKFMYPDNFSMEKEEYDIVSGRVDEYGNNIFAENNNSDPRFHSKWCSMIYERLLLSRNLLSEDGVILVSIGDNELKNLQAIMDEIFGASNQVCYFVWKSRAKPTNAGNARFRPQKVSEYILVYSKSNPETQIYNVIAAKERTYPHEDEGGKFRTTTILTSNRGTFRRETMRFESHGYSPNEDFRWKAGKETIDRLYETNHMFINDDGVPMEKKYAHEESDPLYPIYTYIDSDLSGTAENGKSELNSLVGKQHGFDTVKPVQLLKYMTQTFTDKGGIILDFFSGSGTIAQAVMEQNSEDSAQRKYILVQIEERCNPDGEAFRAGFRTVCDIAKKRIRQAGDKIKADNPLGTQDLDIGFRVFRVDSSNMKDVYYQPEELNQQSIFNLVSNIKDDRTDLDLLYACLLDWGVEIHLPHTSTGLDGCTVHNVDNGALMACFSPNVPRSVVEYMAKQQPLRAVFRDSAFASDDAKINVTEIFKNLSPDTKVKVI